MKRWQLMGRLLICLMGTVVAMLPVFLISALAGEVQGSFGVSDAGIGFLVSVFFGISGVASVHAGRLVASIGWSRGFVLSGVVIAASSFLVAAAATTYWTLLGLLALMALGNALAHPAANLGILNSIDVRRRGVAFGVKQAAVPSATLLAGVILPIAVALLGWRYSFALVGLLGLCLAASALRLSEPHEAPRAVFGSGRERAYDSSNLRVLLVAVGLGGGAANCLGVFLVLHSLNLGYGTTFAAALLASASLANILTRVLVGARADYRVSGHLRVVGWMMATGAVAVVFFAHAGGPFALFVGAILAFVFGWGWNGLLHHGAMSLYVENAAQVTGVLQAGIFAGAVCGPLLFGLIADSVSYYYAWLMVSSALFMSSLLIWQFQRMRLQQSATVLDRGGE